MTVHHGNFTFPHITVPSKFTDINFVGKPVCIIQPEIQSYETNFTLLTSTAELFDKINKQDDAWRMLTHFIQKGEKIQVTDPVTN